MVSRMRAGEIVRCPDCGGNHTVRHGYNVTKKGRWARRKCQGCGRTFYEDKEVSR